LVFFVMLFMVTMFLVMFLIFKKSLEHNLILIK
jgi:hypothetical protein